VTIQAENSPKPTRSLFVRAGADLLKACSVKRDGLSLRLQA
jgi:hypothetical protein